MRKRLLILLALALLLTGCASPEAPAPTEVTVPTETASTLPPETTEPAPPSFEALFAAAEAPQTWAANCNDFISLRPEARFSEALAYIPDGATFTLLQWQERYARISYQGQEGYVLSNYIRPQEEGYFSDLLSVVKPTETYSYEQMLLDLQTLAARHPNTVTLDSIGTSELSREIPVLRIGSADAAHHVLLQGAIHGREHMTAWLLMALADFWLERGIGDYGDICYHILPMTNPDGVTIAQSGSLTEEQARMYFREQAQGITTDTFEQYVQYWKANAFGVDLNRNFSTGWESLSGRTEASSQLYPGEAPFCAAETAALRDYTLAYPFDVTISYHAAGSFIYYEYGEKEPVNAHSQDLATAVSAVTGYPLKPSTGVDAGGYKDWAIDALEIPSLTVEIGCDRAPLLFREIYSIFARNCAVLPAIAQWLYP